MSTNFYPFLIIPIPTEVPVGFGIHATSGPDGCLIQCRGLVVEREYIKRAAHTIGLSYGSFLRRVAMDAAVAVLYQTGERTEPLIPRDVTHRIPNSED